MKTFTIENETNNITIHTTIQDAEGVTNAERFRNETGLAKLAANWPAARLIKIYNSLPGETQVRKFKDRATAVSRIWKALQNLDQAAPADGESAQAPEVLPVAEVPETTLVPEQDASAPGQPEAVIPESTEPAVAATLAPHAPDVASSEPGAKKKATRAEKAPVAASAKDAGAPREGSKTAQVIAMLKREGGATLEEIMTAMSWKKHTTRAMLSAGGSLTKNHGLVVISEKIGDQRRYSIKS